MSKQYSASVSCQVLEVSASGYFNWLRRRESGQGDPGGRHSDEASRVRHQMTQVVDLLGVTS